MPILLAVLGGVALFLLFGVFGGKGGPHETAPPPREEGHWLSRLSPDGAEKLLHRLFAAMRFTVETSEVRVGRLDMIVVDPAPLTGGRVHVRAILRSDRGMIEQAEVQAALDEARGEGIAKAVVISTLGFSAEARTAVASTSCELIDGAGWLALLEKQLPEAVETGGAGYV